MSVLTGDPRGPISQARGPLLGHRFDQRWEVDLLDTDDRTLETNVPGIIGGSIERSIHNTIRTGGSLQVLDPARIDWQRRRVRIRYCYTDEAGDEHDHSLGVFVPGTTGTDYTGPLATATIDLYDKMALLADGVPPNTWSVDKGRTVVGAVTEVIQAVGDFDGEVLRNLHPDPQMASLSTVSGVQSDVSHTGAAVRWTLSGSGSLAFLNLGEGVPTLTSGRQYTLLVRARASRPLFATMRIAADAGFADAPLTTGWQWHRAVAQPGTGTSTATGLRVPQAGVSAGDWVEVDRVLVMAGDYDGPWFAGVILVGDTRINAPDDGGGELTTSMVAEAEDTYLQIANTVLEAGNFFSLWVDGNGIWRLDPYVEPTRRGVSWEYRSGDGAIFYPDFTHEADMYGVPNAVKIVGKTERDDDGNDIPPLIAYARNENPDDPLSIPGRGNREKWHVESDQDTTGQQALEALAVRRLAELSSYTSTYEIDHDWNGLDLNSAVRLVVPEHGIDALCVVQADSWSWDASSEQGVTAVSATLREVKV